MVGKKTINNKGFSLVEVIIAMAILAIVSIPLLHYFSESISYNAKMRTTQQATQKAQNLMEQLKLENKLFVQDSVTGNYTTPYFEDRGIAWHVYNMNNATGIGSVEYQCGAGTLLSDYDVKVTLGSTEEFNNTPQPVIYGIDETKDVMAVEREQLSEAVVYFQSLNADQPAEHAMTQEQIRSAVTRTIHMQFKRNTETSNFHVKIYYVYQCAGLRGTGTQDTYTSLALTDGDVRELNSVYLLFQPANGMEKVVLDYDTGISLPQVYFIRQDDVNYQMQVSGIRIEDSAIQFIHTNHGASDVVKNDTGNDIYHDKLTEETKPIRIVNVEISVYPKGKMGTDDDYVTISSTKGE